MLEHTDLPEEPLNKYRRVKDDTNEFAETEGNENRDLWKNMAHEYCKKVAYFHNLLNIRVIYHNETFVECAFTLRIYLYFFRQKGNWTVLNYREYE